MEPIDYFLLLLLIVAAPILYIVNLVYRLRLKPKYSKLIAESDGLKAIELRKKYKKEKKNCRLNAIILVIIEIVVGSVDDALEGGLTTGAIVKAVLVGFAYIVAEFTIPNARSWLYDDKFVNSVSTYTKQEFLEKYKQFTLYLRAFESDEYEGKSERLLRKIETAEEQGESTIDELFSEKKLVEKIEAVIGLPVGAVGMPKEADQPDDAAIRVYVDGDAWQDDVLSLIQEARFVFVLVASRESCLWEIKQLDQYMDKTIFIIDDVDEYNRSRNVLAGELALPEIPEQLLAEFEHFVLYRKRGEFVFHPFAFSKSGYNNVAYLVMELMPETPISFDGLFARLDELFNRSLLDDPDGVVDRFSQAVNEACPIAVNDKIKISACEFLKSGELFIGVTVPENSVEWLANNRQIAEVFVRNCLLNETSELFKAKCVDVGLLINFDKGDGEIVSGFNIRPSDIEDDLATPLHLQGYPEANISL